MTTANSTFLAIVPARGGSKGIRNKNIRAFASKPLISYTIEAAKQSRHLSRVVVSTESDEIARVARELGAEVPFLRPTEFAQDTSNVFDAVAHLLQTLEASEGYVPDYIVLLQPTSPLRTADDIDDTIDAILAQNADSAITVSRVEPRVFVKGENGVLTLASDEKFLRSTNRQALPHTVSENGAMVYVNRVSTLLATRNFLGGKLVGVETPRWRSIDLDAPEDFVLGELILRHRQEIAKDIREFK